MATWTGRFIGDVEWATIVRRIRTEPFTNVPKNEKFFFQLEFIEIYLTSPMNRPSIRKMLAHPLNLLSFLPHVENR